MKRAELEKYLGKMISIDLIFHEGTVLCGELHKSGEILFRDDPNLYLPENYYFVTTPGTASCISYLFRSSHVRRVKRVHNANRYWLPYGPESEWEKEDKNHDKS